MQSTLIYRDKNLNTGTLSEDLSFKRDTHKSLSNMVQEICNYMTAPLIFLKELLAPILHDSAHADYIKGDYRTETL